MRKLLFTLALLCAFTAQAVNVVFSFQQANTNAQAVRTMYLYLTQPYTNGGGAIVTWDRIISSSSTNGTITISNLYGGTNFVYRSEFQGTFKPTTNWYVFPDTNGFVNAGDWATTLTNSAGIVSYSRAQADGRFYPLDGSKQGNGAGLTNLPLPTFNNNQFGSANSTTNLRSGLTITNEGSYRPTLIAGTTNYAAIILTNQSGSTSNILFSLWAGPKAGSFVITFDKDAPGDAVYGFIDAATVHNGPVPAAGNMELRIASGAHIALAPGVGGGTSGIGHIQVGGGVGTQNTNTPAWLYMQNMPTIGGGSGENPYGWSGALTCRAVGYEGANRKDHFPGMFARVVRTNAPISYELVFPPSFQPNVDSDADTWNATNPNFFNSLKLHWGETTNTTLPGDVFIGGGDLYVTNNLVANGQFLFGPAGSEDIRYVLSSGYANLILNNAGAHHGLFRIKQSGGSLQMQIETDDATANYMPQIAIGRASGTAYGLTAEVNGSAGVKNNLWVTNFVNVGQYAKTSRPSAPAGSVIYQTDNTPGLRVYNGTHWVKFTEANDD